MLFDQGVVMWWETSERAADSEGTVGDHSPHAALYTCPQFAVTKRRSEGSILIPIRNCLSKSQGSATAVISKCGDGKDSAASGYVDPTGVLAFFCPTPECLSLVVKIDRVKTDRKLNKMFTFVYQRCTGNTNYQMLCRGCPSALTSQRSIIRLTLLF